MTKLLQKIDAADRETLIGYALAHRALGKNADDWKSLMAFCLEIDRPLVERVVKAIR